jgi:Fe-S-cluster containining protein
MKISSLILFRTFLRLIRDIDGLFSKYSTKLIKKQYRIVGSCKQDGQCCKKIAIYLSDGFWHYKKLKNLAVKWYTFVYNFTFISENPDLKIILFSCNYLKKNKCQIHYRRPFICRKYPEGRYFEQPCFLPDCGFSAEITNKTHKVVYK